MQCIPDEVVRSRLHRALEIDRRLWTQYPDSLPSCVLARTLGDCDVAELHARWILELDERATPWIAALRPLPVTAGLLAELYDGDHDISLKDYHGPLSFDSDDVVSLRSIRPSAAFPGGAHLRWSWARREVTVGPAPQPDMPADVDRFPRIHNSGAAFLIRGTETIRLPCPEGGIARAQFTADGSRLIVYGTLGIDRNEDGDEDKGGFVHVVNPTTLAIERSLETRRSVGEVYDCACRDLLLVLTSEGLAAWVGEQVYELPLKAGSFDQQALSPTGTYLVSFLGARLQVWSLDELIRRGRAPLGGGFPTCFDPSGDRLVSGRWLFDGRSGRLIAEVDSNPGGYLEGGPALPWLHFGTRYLISEGASRVWDTRSGQRREAQEELFYPQWYSLAYDREGVRLAALHRRRATVTLRELPGGRLLRELSFELKGTAVAMSPDGRAIAIQRGRAVEVRADDGALLLRAGHAVGAPESKYIHDPNDHTLRFSVDGQRIARFVEGDGWRIWSLVDKREDHVVEHEAIDELTDFASPWPSDWTLEAGAMTLFTHRPSGTRIALPAAGPWVCNPADPRILACDAVHLELRVR